MLVLQDKVSHTFSVKTVFFIHLAFTLVKFDWPRIQQQGCLSPCMCIYLSSCPVFFPVCLFFSLIKEKVDWSFQCQGQYTCLNVMFPYGCCINNNLHVCSMQWHWLFGLYTQKHFPIKNYTSLFSDFTVLWEFPGSSKSLCIWFFFFFKPTSFSHFLKSLFLNCKMRPNEVSCRLHLHVVRVHIAIYRSHIVVFFSFVMDNCVFPNEPLSDGFLRNRLFGESEVSVPSDVIV